MVSSLSKNMSVFAAEQFLESLYEQDYNNLYLTIGRVDAWPDENSPNKANSSPASFYEIWRNMIGGKKITGNDARHAIPRYNWVSGNTYHAYHQNDDIAALHANGVQFYVVTDEWNVYKCLSNNTNVVSTYKPYQTEAGKTQTTADGYIWKYMYTLSAADQLRFTTNEYIPVKTLNLDDNSLQWDVQQAAFDGGIEAARITNRGSGYTASSNVRITVKGDGDAAELTPVINVAAGKIDRISVENPGFGYTFASATITSNVGTGASCEVIISPPGGHGSNPVDELGGSAMMINTRLKGSEGGKIQVTNDYRQIALIQDPYIFGTTTRAANSAFSQLTLFNVNGSSLNYIEDEIVFQGTTLETAFFTAKVAKWIPSSLELYLTNCIGVPRPETVTGQTSKAVWFVNNITYPTLEPFSGKMLYTDNIKLISRASDQTEDFKIIIKF